METRGEGSRLQQRELFSLLYKHHKLRGCMEKKASTNWISLANQHHHNHHHHYHIVRQVWLDPPAVFFLAPYPPYPESHTHKHTHTCSLLLPALPCPAATWSALSAYSPAPQTPQPHTCCAALGSRHSTRPGCHLHVVKCVLARRLLCVPCMLLKVCCDGDMVS